MKKITMYLPSIALLATAQINAKLSDQSNKSSKALTDIIINRLNEDKFVFEYVGDVNRASYSVNLSSCTLPEYTKEIVYDAYKENEVVNIDDLGDCTVNIDIYLAIPDDNAMGNM